MFGLKFKNKNDRFFFVFGIIFLILTVLTSNFMYFGIFLINLLGIISRADFPLKYQYTKKVVMYIAYFIFFIWLCYFCLEWYVFLSQ